MCVVVPATYSRETEDCPRGYLTKWMGKIVTISPGPGNQIKGAYEASKCEDAGKLVFSFKVGIHNDDNLEGRLDV
jgi:hypothetical protein